MGAGLASTAKRGLAVIKDVEVVGARMASEGFNVARAGTQKVAAAAMVAGKTAKRTTRSAAQGTAEVARMVEHTAEAVADKLK